MHYSTYILYGKTRDFLPKKTKKMKDGNFWKFPRVMCLDYERIKDLVI